MRTTLDLPEVLLKEAMKAAHAKTKTSVIIQALEELVQKSKITSVKDFKGKLNLNVNINDLRKRTS